MNKVKEQIDSKVILHRDHGLVYSSRVYKELIGIFNITHSMSRAGAHADNPKIEVINDWLKEELFIDFNIKKRQNVIESIINYIKYFNNERPSFTLRYLTPLQYKQRCLQNRYECI